MNRLAARLSLVVMIALPIVGCGKNRSPVSPSTTTSTITQSGSGNSGSADTATPARVDGVISDFSGGASAFQFRLGGRLVRGDGASKVMDGSRTRDGSALRNGLRANVDGLDRGDQCTGPRSR